MADCEDKVIKDALKKEFFTEATEFCGKVSYQLLIKLLKSLMARVQTQNWMKFFKNKNS